MDIVKENIECEQLLGENFCDTVVKSEYVIPDTNPDVSEILMLKSKSRITNTEVMKGKVFIEGEVEYTILYSAKEEEEGTGIYGVTYSGKFANYVELPEVDYRMHCDSSCYIEHMECMVVNERKVSIEGIIKLKAEVYKNYDFEVIKDVTGSEDVQMLKNPAAVDKIMGTVSGDLVAKCSIKVPIENPQIGSILENDVKLHKKEVNIMENKVTVSLYALVSILYRGKDTKDLVYMSEDVPISKELDLDGVNPSMESYTDFRIDAVEYDVKEDDLGEDRIIDIEALIKSDTKVMCKQELDIIQDAYSPTIFMDMTKKDYQLNVMHGQSTYQDIIKEDIEIDSNMPKASKIIMCDADVSVTDKKLVEDKAVVDGVLNVRILYKTNNDEKEFYTVNEEIPFSCGVEILECKIDMQCIAKVSLESIEAFIELDRISVKAIVNVYARVNYSTHREFLVDIVPKEEGIPEKKASLTIYVVEHGDTLWKIAKKYYTTVDLLVKLNEIEDPDIIKVGDKLIIPGRAII